VQRPCQAKNSFVTLKPLKNTTTTIAAAAAAAAIAVFIYYYYFKFLQLYKAGWFINLKHRMCDSSILNFYYCYWDINFLARWQIPKMTSFCIFI
jgi:hypothetical protein